jgi:hypothetical protein
MRNQQCIYAALGHHTANALLADDKVHVSEGTGSPGGGASEFGPTKNRAPVGKPGVERK